MMNVRLDHHLCQFLATFFLLLHKINASVVSSIINRFLYGMYVHVLCSLLKMKFLNAIHTDYRQKVKTGFSLAILKKEMFHLVYL